MITSANKYTIADIFSIDKQIKYIIPKYQREFTWTKEDWEDLLNDIDESDGSHFIGSIICINKGVDVLQVAELEVVDGQQRLSTISLLYCAIYSLLKNSNLEEDEDLKNELWNLKSRLIQKQNKSELKLELSHQNNNFSDYQAVLTEIGILDFSDNTQNRGNRRIFKAFRYFIERLEKLDKPRLVDLLTKINNTLLVKIEVSSHSDAFMLFESLNNRGVPLSAIDLIKNKMLAELEKKDKMSIDTAFSKWNTIINNLPDYPIQERFLRQFYNAFKYNPDIKVDGIPRATKSSIIKIYETLITRDPDSIFDKLYSHSAIYHNLIFYKKTEVSSEFLDLTSELRDLDNVKAAPAYAFLLYLFAQKEKLNLNFYKDVLNFLVKYFIRRNITDFPNTRNLDQIFIDLIEEMEKDKSKINMSFINEFLMHDSRISSLNTFREKMTGNIYEMNVDATRFILSKIEETKGTKETFTDFWARDKSKKLVWTIEHIFPEGQNIPKPWIEMIADGDKEKAELIQEECVHTLGNLTLTGYNQELSNYEFKKKRDRKNKADNYTGYKNKLFLNEDLKDKESWTKGDILNRTEKLVKLAVDIFNINNK